MVAHSTGKQFTFAPTSVKQGQVITDRRKACDRCRRRKIGCDGNSTCRPCSQSRSQCTYLVPQQRAGRKGRKPREQTARDWPAASTARSSDEVLGSPPPGASAPEVLRGCLVTDPSEMLTPEFFTPILTDNANSAGWQHECAATELCRETPSTVVAADGLYLDSYGPIDEGMSKGAIHWSQFVPYVELFLYRLYPVLPVFDSQFYAQLLSSLSAAYPQALESDRRVYWRSYSLLCSLCATLAVTLNIDSQSGLEESLSILGISSHSPTQFVPIDHFVNEALQARREFDYMDNPTEETIMTSFFIFGYYGNVEQSSKAWYYLREAVGFALALGLDNPVTYAGLSSITAQRRSTVFWLLFVTERAYALQHRSGVMLKQTIDPPRIFNTPDPATMSGFVNLVNLFRSVENGFVAAWKTIGDAASPTTTTNSIVRAPVLILSHGVSTDKNVDSALWKICETQKLDFLVTRLWLIMLSWQFQNRVVSVSAIQSSSTFSSRPIVANRMLPFQSAHQLLDTISNADRLCLESHGIGMEQKIFDIASCLVGVLETSANLPQKAVSIGHNHLHGIMTRLAAFRNRESKYLQPLVARASSILSAGLLTCAAVQPTEHDKKTAWTETTDVSAGSWRQC